MASVAPPRNRRVLVVDDDELMRRAVARQLRRLGFDADVAADGPTALRLSAAREYDVLLSDLVMSRLDGFELMARFAEKSDVMSFVLMTGAGDLKDHPFRPVDGRLTAVLTKPIGDFELQRALEQAFLVADARRVLTRRFQADVRLLLIEDSPSDALLFQSLLDKLGGFEVVRTTRLAEAVKLLHSEAFDTVVTDLSLPDARGLDAVLRIRDCAPDATLLVCSAVQDEAIAEHVLELGAQDFIVKDALDAESLGRAVRFARVRRQGERRLTLLARRDALTGLANRTAFSERLDQALAQARRQGTEFGLMYIDLDGFKAVNDLRGHDAGDAVLRQVAERIRRGVRDYDLVARLGGDEFAVLAPNLSAAALFATAERIEQSIAVPLDLEGGPAHVTASIGVASYPSTAQEASLLVKLADEAMYAAKSAGKGRVHVAATRGLAPASRLGSS